MQNCSRACYWLSSDLEQVKDNNVLVNTGGYHWTWTKANRFTINRTEWGESWQRAAVTGFVISASHWASRLNEQKHQHKHQTANCAKTWDSLAVGDKSRKQHGGVRQQRHCSTCRRIARTWRLQTSQCCIDVPIGFSQYVLKVGHGPWSTNAGWRYSGRHRLFGLLYTRAMLQMDNTEWRES